MAKNRAVAAVSSTELKRMQNSLCNCGCVDVSFEMRPRGLRQYRGQRLEPIKPIMGVPNKLLTLVFARKPGKLLLGMKKRGFGEGRWNGFGGKVEKGETIEQGARREMLEESCVTINTIEEVARIDFEFVGEEQIMEVHVFQTHDFQEEPQETEEMCPKWYEHDDIPFDKMWPDDIYWFPYLLGDKKFKAFFKFEGMDKILEQHIEEVKTL